jgi:lysine 2,3-aminomutase
MQQQLCIITPANTFVNEQDEEPPGTCVDVPGEIHTSTLNIFQQPSDTLKISVKEYRPTGRTTPQPDVFRRVFFPKISNNQWNDWHWQIQNRIHTYVWIDQILRLSGEEKQALAEPGRKLPVGITPYYMSLLSPFDPNHPLRRTVIPTVHEFFKMPCEADDPLGEEAMSPVPGLVHRYPDRALLLVTDFCSTYCRYCTRSRMVGHNSVFPSKSRIGKAIEYIRQTPSVRDVILSGGDPLTLNEDRLEWILKELRQIRHLEIIRIGTKMPAVLPQRITPKLTRMLRKYHPLWMSLHFVHPEECTPEAYKACGMLADAGIPLGAQTVLLKGINDSVSIMKDLVHHLLRMRVRPYYLYQCDPISGSGHFRTSVETGIEIIKGLRGFTSGYAIPTYVIDAPGGGGKVPLMPDYVVGKQDGELILKNYEDKIYRYPEPRNSRIEKNGGGHIGCNGIKRN